MRPRFHWVFVAALSAGFVFAWTAKWNGFSHGEWVWTTASAQNPVPGDMPSPSLVPPQPLPSDDNGNTAASANGTEVLSQGPVHEAFASPMELNPQAGPVVKKRPPDPIKEIPPAQQPDGENIVWIPGYWGWDDDRQDFIWISGLWRAAPPYQTWVPGYWSEVDGGYQWTPGLWTAAAQQEVSYLPAPPASQEHGPSSPQPSDNQFWIPGTWVYQNADYAWRDGYWTVARPNWIWVPAHYCWTPSGYVFVDGYWDYELTRRGCLFAPVYFAQSVYAQPAFVYTPGVVFNVGLFSNWLFVRPTFGAYYFGDYFGPSYVGLGFSPWFSISIGGRPHFDPLFTYYNWHNSLADRNWLVHTQQHFDMLRTDAALRPPHTFAAQQQWLKNNPGARAGNLALVSPLREVAKDPAKSGFQFHTVSMADRQALAVKGNELQESAMQRSNFERKTNLNSLGGSGTQFNSRGNGFNPDKGNTAGTTSGSNGNDVHGGVATSKFKLPTAASSKMSNPGNPAGSTTSMGGSQLGMSSGSNGQGNASNNRFGNNLSANNGSAGNNGSTGPKFNSGNGAVENQSDRFGSSSNSNSSTSGAQSTQRINRPSLIQPGSGVQAGDGNPSNTYSGNAISGSGNQNFGGSSQSPSSGNQSSQRMQLYPGAGGTGANPNTGNGSGRGGNGGQGNTNKDDPNKKNKTSDIPSPHPYTNITSSKPSLIDTQSILKADRKSSQNAMAMPDDPTKPKSKATSFDLSSDDAESGKSGSGTAKHDDANSAAGGVGPSKTPQLYHLPPLFRAGTGDDFRSPLLTGIPNPSATPDGNSSENPESGTTGNTPPDDGSADNGTPESEHRLAGYGPNAAHQSTTLGAPQGTSKKSAANSGASPTMNPGLVKYDYQTLAERGHTLSTPRTSYSPTASSATSYEQEPTPYENSPSAGPLDRNAVSPVTSIGPGGGSHTLYGPLGTSNSAYSPSSSAMPMGPLNSISNSGAGSYSSGGYIPSSTLPSLQHFDLHLPKPTAATPYPDAGQRTYDPAHGGYGN